MKPIFHILCLIAIGCTSLAAASSVTLTITFDLTDDIAIVWTDDTVPTTTGTAQTWALGAVALDTAYNTATSGLTYNYLKNTSTTNTALTISAQITTAPTGWSQGGTRGTDTYTLKLSTDSGATYPTDLTTTNTAIAALALADNTSYSPEMDFEFGTPTAIASGANGAGLSIITTFTATAQ